MSWQPLFVCREIVRLNRFSQKYCPRGQRLLQSVASDAVYQPLMKHLHHITKNPRHVVYALRHNMKDRLVAAGVDQRDENRIFGHALGGLGDHVYGGSEARLKAAYEAMERTLEAKL